MRYKTGKWTYFSKHSNLQQYIYKKYFKSYSNNNLDYFTVLIEAFVPYSLVLQLHLILHP
jgi:hypothetical protein